MSDKDWIGVELDGTLATEVSYQDALGIGQPVAMMVKRVKWWLDEGKDVRIITARVEGITSPAVTAGIRDWCIRNLGKILPIVSGIDEGTTEFWSARAVQVVKNTGRISSSENLWRDQRMFDARAQDRKDRLAKIAARKTDK
jgi:hypothetical protein